MPIAFVGAVPRALDEKLGDSVSILDFGAIPDGVTDCSEAFAKAIIAADAIDGAKIEVPRGTYNLTQPVVIGAGVDNISFVGDGIDATIITRGADMPAGYGVFDLSGSRVTFANLTFDGGVLVPTQKLYGTFIGENGSDDPMHPDLTGNSAFWIHAGVKAPTFYKVAIRHTGGYAILLDARDGNITDPWIYECLLENNRPHLFGSSGGDLNYGAWTGGIHYQGDCRSPKLYGVHNLYVRGCTFRRGSGNQLWGHAYGFDTLHSNHRLDTNNFEDILRDGIMCGALSGGVVCNNTFRRIGYYAADDEGASVPKYLQYHYAVALDTAGLVRGVNYVNNSFLNCYVGCMDLDGYSDGVVSGNTCRVSYPGEPEYTEDSVASWSIGNYTYGCQVSNSNNLGAAGKGVTVIANRFINMGGGAVRFYATRASSITDNLIEHAADAHVAPIQLGNIGNGSNQRSYDNSVTDNKIFYDPSIPVGAIQENKNASVANPAGYPFLATDKNWISNNKLTGAKVFEFLKDPDSGSGVFLTLSSASATAGRSETLIQREGVGLSAVTRMYSREGSTVASLLSVFDSGVLNMSINGAAGTGSLTTGNRSTVSWGDTVASGKLLGDSFLALTQLTFADTQANALDDSWGLLRYNSSLKKFEISISVSGGGRVWEDLSGVSGGGTSGGDATFTTLNSMLFRKQDNIHEGGEARFQGAGSFQDVALDNYDGRIRLFGYGVSTDVTVEITGKDTTPALVLSKGYIQSKEGLYSEYTSPSTVHIPFGGGTFQTVTVTGSSLLPGLNLSNAAGIPRLIRWYTTGVARFDIGVNAASESAGTNLGSDLFVRRYSDAGVAVTTAMMFFHRASGTVVINGASTTASGAILQVAGGFIESAQGFYTPVSNTADQAIQALGGGVWANKLISNTGVYVGSTVPANPSSGGGLAYVSGSTYRYWNGSAWATVDLSVIGGSTSWIIPAQDGVSEGGELRFNGAGSYPAGIIDRVNDYFRLYSTEAGNWTQLEVHGRPLTWGLNVLKGYVQAEQGFVTPYDQYNAISAAAGGVLCKTLQINYHANNIYPFHIYGLHASHFWAVGIAATEALAGYYFEDINKWYPTRFYGGMVIDNTYSQAGQIGLEVLSGRVDSSGGFYTPIGNAFAIQAPYGGVFAQTITLTGNGGIVANFSTPAGNSRVLQWSSSGVARWHMGVEPTPEIGGDVGSNFYLFAWNDANTSGRHVLYAHRQSGHLYVGNYSDTGSGAILQVTGFVESSLGFYSSYGGSNSIQTPGEVRGGKLTSTTAVYLGTSAAAPATGFGGLAWAGGSSYYYWNGSSFQVVDLASVGGSPNFSATIGMFNDLGYRLVGTGFKYLDSDAQHIAHYKKAGGYGFYWRKSADGHFDGAGSTDLMSLDDNGLLFIRSYLQTNGGVYVPPAGLGGTNADTAIQAPGGGVYANKVISLTGVYMGSTVPANPGSGGGMGHVSGSSYRFWNGSAWISKDVNLIPGQALETTSLPTFNFLRLTSSLTNALEIPTGYATALGYIATNSAANESIQTTGGVKSNRGYFIGSSITQVINSSGVFVGPGVNVGMSGCAARAFNPYGGDGAVRTGIDRTNLFSGGGGAIAVSTPGGTINLHFIGGALVAVA